ncbi:MAG: DUF523 domain-containing protein [Gammaproteobacteria bacterium]|nr:DUF523 domain-containing protein [Gammaproteobacteria bacterium]MDH5778769.1 DUF523 domain-containing protein [Gammaproteobacteria bacterium]
MKCLPKLGISSCLLGENVRYDGKNKKDEFILQKLLTDFELVPFCPEVAIGMGIPRPPVHLVDAEGEIRSIGIDNPDQDITVPLKEYADQIHEHLADLSGYIFKSKSPSCGINQVKVWTGQEYQLIGQGIFSKAIIQSFPDMPVIDEQQFKDVLLLQQFLKNVKKYHSTLTN